MILPLSAGIVHGGVRMQSVRTAEYLGKLGHEITRFNPWDTYRPEDFDIIHLFLAGNETLTIASKIADSSIPFVVSPVFFTRRSARTIRSVIKTERIGSQFVRGIFSDYSIKARVCSSAALVLPNTKAEGRLIAEGFGIAQNKIQVVPNGVELRFENATPDLFHKTYNIKNFILFVGDGSARRKNLYSLLQHYSPEDPPLVITGNLDDSKYSRTCLSIINKMDNIYYTGPVTHDDPMLASAYAAARVFTLPSQFETPGIAALEAALAGCAIAITKEGGTIEYFKNYAEYIDPESGASMISAIRSAYSKPRTDKLTNHIRENYSWQIVAKKTEEAYRSIL